MEANVLIAKNSTAIDYMEKRIDQLDEKLWEAIEKLRVSNNAILVKMGSIYGIILVLSQALLIFLK